MAQCQFRAERQLLACLDCPPRIKRRVGFEKRAGLPGYGARDARRILSAPRASRITAETYSEYIRYGHRQAAYAKVVEGLYIRAVADPFIPLAVSRSCLPGTLRAAGRGTCPQGASTRTIHLPSGARTIAARAFRPE